jgi:uncharacterized membrane protein
VSRWRPATREQVIDVVALVVVVMLIAFVTARVAGGIRTVLTIGFLTFVPGWTLARYAPFARSCDLPARCAIAVASSLAISGLLATVVLWAHAWAPVALFYAEAIVSAALISSNLVAETRVTPNPGQPPTEKSS